MSQRQFPRHCDSGKARDCTRSSPEAGASAAAIWPHSGTAGHAENRFASGKRHPGEPGPAPGPTTRWMLRAPAAPPPAPTARRIASSTAAGSRTDMHSRLERSVTSAMLPPATQRRRARAPASAGRRRGRRATRRGIAARHRGTLHGAARISDASWSAIGPTTTCTAPSASLQHAARAQRLERALVDARRIGHHQAQSRGAGFDRAQVRRRAQRRIHA